MPESFFVSWFYTGFMVILNHDINHISLKEN